MLRVVRVAMCVVLGLFVFAVSSQAQPAAGSSDNFRYWADFNVAATVGHKSSGSVGGEAGVVISGPFGVYVEGGRMMNVGTEDLDQRALKIANAVGATASTSYKVNYFDAGIKVAPELYWPVHPYVMFGVGVAQVRAETALAVNGTTVPPESLGVQFGSDLHGVEKKAIIIVGGGAAYTFATRYFADFSVRYGRILPKTDVIENDKGINTARLQLGVGVKF